MPVAVGIMADSYNKPSGAFDPLSIPWHSAFWASDPGWIPPADGAAVASWKNSGTSAANATNASGVEQPTYRAAFTALNGKPAVDFPTPVGGFRLNTSTPSITQPNHIFVVGWLNPTHPADATICDSVGTTARHIVRNLGAGSTVLLYAGAVANTTGGGVSNAYALSTLFNGASSAVRMNGTAYPIGNVGAQAFDQIRIGGDAGGGSAPGHYAGAIAFLGVSDTTLTAQQITDLETWAKNFYGVPIP